MPERLYVPFKQTLMHCGDMTRQRKWGFRLGVVNHGKGIRKHGEN